MNRRPRVRAFLAALVFVAASMSAAPMAVAAPQESGPAIELSFDWLGDLWQTFEAAWSAITDEGAEEAPEEEEAEETEAPEAEVGPVMIPIG